MIKTNASQIVFIAFISLLACIVSHGAEDYYSMERDHGNTRLARMGKSKYFQSSLDLDKKTGEIKYSLLCKTDTRVEFNIEYNLGKDGFLEKLSASGELPISDSSGRPGYSLDFVHPEKNVRRHYPMISPNHPFGNEKTKKEEYVSPGIIQMRKGEMYVCTGKVWDMNIWNDLVDRLEENKDVEYEINLSTIVKVDDTFYMANAGCPIDRKTVRSLKNIKTAAEKKTAASPPEDDDDEGIPVNIQKEGDGTTRVILGNGDE